MEPDVASVLRQLSEDLRERHEKDEIFRERLLEELRRLNRTLERMYDKDLGGPL